MSSIQPRQHFLKQELWDVLEREAIGARIDHGALHEPGGALTVVNVLPGAVRLRANYRVSVAAKDVTQRDDTIGGAVHFLRLPGRQPALLGKAGGYSPSVFAHVPVVTTVPAVMIAHVAVLASVPVVATIPMLAAIPVIATILVITIIPATTNVTIVATVPGSDSGGNEHVDRCAVIAITLFSLLALLATLSLALRGGAPGEDA